MSLHTFTGFVAEFPVVYDGIHTDGQELAEFIAIKMRDKGFSTQAPSNSGDSWDFYTTQDQFEIFTTVGFVGDSKSDPPRQWLITNQRSAGLFQRLFGSKSQTEQHIQFLRSFCESMHQVISEDDRFSNILWYDSATFDKPDDQPADSP